MKIKVYFEHSFGLYITASTLSFGEFRVTRSFNPYTFLPCGDSGVNIGRLTTGQTEWLNKWVLDKKDEFMKSSGFGKCGSFERILEIPDNLPDNPVIKWD